MTPSSRNTPKRLVPIIQEAGAAALIAGDSRVAGRARADGLHISGNAEALGEAVEKHTPKLIVGGGNAADRHHALQIGEVRPDYVFFGKTDGDIKPDAHPKNLALAEWWASMIEIPCIVMGGTDPQSGVGGGRDRRRVRGAAPGRLRRARAGAVGRCGRQRAS